MPTTERSDARPRISVIMRTKNVEEIVGQALSGLFSQTLSDFTLKAVLVGITFGILFGMANAYLGLKVGLTVSTAIPLAVISVALFRAFRRIWGPSTILEHNIAQTTGSASSSLASGVIFTIPALYMWGADPPLIQVVLLAFLDDDI